MLLKLGFYVLSPTSKIYEPTVMELVAFSGYLFAGEYYIYIFYLYFIYFFFFFFFLSILYTICHFIYDYKSL